MSFASCIYAGTVVHKRVSPKLHGFSYRVFSLCVDVDEIDELDRKLTFFSRGRWNLLSLRDGDFAGGEATIGDAARRQLRDAGLDHFGSRIQLLCYPRVLGFAFNPLSVYFCHDAEGRLGVIIYEVSNTIGQRRSYIIPNATIGDGVIAQHCRKQMYVSPFTDLEGSYGFHVRPPADEVVVGVDFREGGKPVLKTHFRGARIVLSDASIAALLVRYPLMTLKVISGIHIEAARLWMKRVPLRDYRASPRFASTHVKSPEPSLPHA